MNNFETAMLKAAVQETEQDFIAVKPCCEFFGIDYKNQVERIKSDIVLSQLVGKNHLTGADGKQYSMLSLPKSGFLRWVNTLNPNLIAEELRQKFINFLLLLNDYLYGELSPGSMAKKKHLELSQIRESIMNKETEIEDLRRDKKKKEKELKELNSVFWELFNSDPYQLKLKIA